MIGGWPPNKERGRCCQKLRQRGRYLGAGYDGGAMARKVLPPVAWVLALSSLGVTGRDDKVLLRYRFERGRKIRLSIGFAAVVKLDQVPESLKGLWGETLVDIKVDGVIDSEVREVGDDGKAVVDGKWRTLKAKGSWLSGDVDFAYDSEKPDEGKARKREGPGDDLLMGDVESGLRALVREPVVLSVDVLGGVKIKEGGGEMGGFIEQVLLLNGLMGPLPKDPVGRGDGWKGDEKIHLPGVGEALSIVVRSENRYESDEVVDGHDCALIRSKLTVGGEGGAKMDMNNPFPFQMKTTGEGEGKLWFCRGRGMAAKCKTSLGVRFSVALTPDDGGDEIEIKGTLKIDQGHDMK